MNWQDKLTTAFIHILMWWCVLICLCGAVTLTAIMIKFAYKLVIK